MNDFTAAGTDPSPHPKAAAKAAKAYAKATRPWFKKKRWWATGVIVLLLGASALGGEEAKAPGDNVAGVEKTEASPSVESSDISGNEAKADPEPAPPAEPEMTPSQEQAVRAAENYLSTMPFSKRGLIDQLSSDFGSGFDRADATFAVRNIEVNWKEQAVKAAENYLETMPFSRQGLIEQLSSEHGSQFTVPQATHAADSVGL